MTKRTTLEELREHRPFEYAQVMSLRANELRRLLNARLLQAGAKAAATQRKIDALYRDTPGLDGWVRRIK